MWIYYKYNKNSKDYTDITLRIPFTLRLSDSDLLKIINKFNCPKKFSMEWIEKKLKGNPYRYLNRWLTNDIELDRNGCHRFECTCSIWWSGRGRREGTKLPEWKRLIRDEYLKFPLFFGSFSTIILTEKPLFKNKIWIEKDILLCWIKNNEKNNYLSSYNKLIRLLIIKGIEKDQNP